MIKKILLILYILILVCMAAASIVEKTEGTDYAHVHYYGAWWFILIWAALAALGIFYLIQRKVKAVSTWVLKRSYQQFRNLLIVIFSLVGIGFIFLIYHFSHTDFSTGERAPILNSPYFCLHVSVIMMSYVLLILTCLCGILGICWRSRQERMRDLSHLFLYPALTTMGFGIFIGAIWANVSWGNYWSWDSKETWALITFMIYAVVVHTQSLPVFRNPLVYHIYITLAFMSIAMTYFGVNYFLTGMHSYA